MSPELNDYWLDNQESHTANIENLGLQRQKKRRKC